MKYQKLINKILFVLLLGPLVPILGIPGENDSSGNSEGNNDTGNNADNESNNSNGNEENNSFSNNNQVVFASQAEFDRTIQNRINKAVSAAVKANEDKHNMEKLSETDRLKVEKEQAEKNALSILESANQRLINAEVISISAKLGIIDPSAAYALMNKEDVSVTDTGSVVGVENALKLLIKDKSYLVGTNQNTNPKPGGDDQNSNPGKNTSNFNMNQLIRKACGRE